MRQYIPFNLEVYKRVLEKVPCDDRGFLAAIFSRIPHHIMPRLLTEWERRHEAQGRYAAYVYAQNLRELLPELFPDTALPFDATYEEITDAAVRAVRSVRERVQLHEKAGEEKTIAALARVARRYRIELPHCKTFMGVIARMTEKAWWRRALRKRFRVVEHAAIRVGYIHRHAAPYVSDEAFRRNQGHAKKTAALLEILDAINENTGECIPLAEIVNRSLANPANRRIAMMVCLRGLEDFARTCGHVGLFVTITCPSRMHARHNQSGDANPSYDGTSPRAAQLYLSKLWNSARRKLDRAGIACFGVRITEPHHDGTPHWHLIIFLDPARESDLVEILRAYALQDSPNEPGAEHHRFIVQRIDPARGSATGYIAKYISKNIDGEGVGNDFETASDTRATAPRTVVWARLWGVRQFQFFGIPILTPFRELFRLDRVPDLLQPLIGDLYCAAKASDFGAYVHACKAQGTRLATLRDDKPSKRYPGEITQPLRGIKVFGDAGWIPMVTRPDEWRIKRRQTMKGAPWHYDFVFPWTRFNNSADRDFMGFFGASDTQTGSETRPSIAVKASCRRRNGGNIALGKAQPPLPGANSRTTL